MAGEVRTCKYLLRAQRQCKPKHFGFEYRHELVATKRYFSLKHQIKIHKKNLAILKYILLRGLFLRKKLKNLFHIH